MSATPRVDAECYWHTSEDGWHLLEKTTPEKGNWVPVKLARQLEQELTAAKELLEGREKVHAALKEARKWSECEICETCGGQTIPDGGCPQCIKEQLTERADNLEKERDAEKAAWAYEFERARGLDARILELESTVALLTSDIKSLDADNNELRNQR